MVSGITQPFIYNHFTASNLRRGVTISADTLSNRAFDNQMRNLTQNDLDELNVQMAVRVGLMKITVGFIRDAKKRATKLLQYTQKHFHVE